MITRLITNFRILILFVSVGIAVFALIFLHHHAHAQQSAEQCLNVNNGDTVRNQCNISIVVKGYSNHAPRTPWVFSLSPGGSKSAQKSNTGTVFSIRTAVCPEGSKIVGFDHYEDNDGYECLETGSDSASQAGLSEPADSTGGSQFGNQTGNTETGVQVIPSESGLEAGTSEYKGGEGYETAPQTNELDEQNPVEAEIETSETGDEQKPVDAGIEASETGNAPAPVVAEAPKTESLGPKESLEKGLAAFENGEFKTAFNLLSPYVEIDGYEGESNERDAQYSIGWMYAKGYGVKQDWGKAGKWFGLAANRGHFKAQAELGHMYYNGEGVAQDYAEAVKWYSLAADQGHVGASGTLREIFDKGESAYNNKSYSEALKIFTALAEHGHGRARFKLGIMYFNGYGVSQNHTEAVKWIRLAAKQGLDVAQGIMYYNGYGVSQNYTEAVKWFRLAAEQGDADAQFSLGYMYYNGEGVRRNRAEAKKWFKRAADQGYKSAQQFLRDYY